MNEDEKDVPQDFKPLPETQTQAVTVREAVQALEPTKPQVTTAAQAKIDAVAKLTMQCFERASTLVLTPEEREALMRDFPDEAFKPGAAGKEKLLYIEHAFLRDRLTEVLGMGQWALIPRNRWGEDFSYMTYREGRQVQVQGTRIYVEAMLVVRGCFVGEAVGEMEYYPKNVGANYGDAVEGAKTAAFRRCCKEFGIGLQAWKKDWCEGWWQRNPKGRVNTPTQGTPTPMRQKAQEGMAKAQTTNPPPPTAETRPVATQAHKDRLLVVLDTDNIGLPLAEEFFAKVGALLPNETMIDLPLEFVPVSKEQCDALIRSLAAFQSGEEARLPYPKNPKVFDKEPAEDVKSQPWYPILVPIPRKGQTRDEYLQAPDTIGSLYEARHGTDDLAQEARQRLWGFVEKYEPKPWTKRDGTQMPPSETDRKFRAALDAFKAYFDQIHPGEKL